MEIRRILGGEDLDEDGFKYNGKIQGLQRRLSEIADLGRYSYRVTVIANIATLSEQDLRRLTGGIQTQVINLATAYTDLLYPVISGSLFTATGISISLDISNKSSGAKIGYNITIGGFDCEITVVFVPTIEIAEFMSKYKNSVLLYNPRSYLEFEGQVVNDAITYSIMTSEGNEFALLNNGITFVCDESGVNEHSGRKHRAKLFLLNPQIINGGQTAYTLSRLYEKLSERDRKERFSGKEVLVKA
jgi:hypothetical protein